MITYGAQALTLTSRTAHQLQVTQRAMGRTILDISIRDRVPIQEI